LLFWLEDCGIGGLWPLRGL